MQAGCKVACPSMRVVIMSSESLDYQDASLAAGAYKFVLKNRIPAKLPLIVKELRSGLNTPNRGPG